MNRTITAKTSLKKFEPKKIPKDCNAPQISSAGTSMDLNFNFFQHIKVVFVLNFAPPAKKFLAPQQVSLREEAKSTKKNNRLDTVLFKEKYFNNLKPEVIARF